MTLIAISGATALGVDVLIGAVLYGSSNVEVDPTDHGTLASSHAERVTLFSTVATLVETEAAIVGISMPDRMTVATVAVELGWAIRQTGLWSDVTLASPPVWTLQPHSIRARRLPLVHRGADRR